LRTGWRAVLLEDALAEVFPTRHPAGSVTRTSCASRTYTARSFACRVKWLGGHASKYPASPRRPFVIGLIAMRPDLLGDQVAIQHPNVGNPVGFHLWIHSFLGPLTRWPSENYAQVQLSTRSTGMVMSPRLSTSDHHLSIGAGIPEDL